MGLKKFAIGLLWSFSLHAADWSAELSLGFPDSPALRLSSSVLDQRLTFFAQTASPFMMLVKSEVPRKTLSRKESVAVQSEPQDLQFQVRIASLYATGLEWFPLQGSWFLQGAYEQRQLSIASQLSTPFRFVTARDTRLSRSEMEAVVRTRSLQHLLRLATGQRFHLSPRWSFGWYCGFTEVLRTQSQVQALVGLKNREATLRREAEAENLQDALNAQSENLRFLAARELERITRQRMPLLGLSLGLHF